MTDWIEWKGGECPVREDTLVLYKTRTQTHTTPRRAGDLHWSHCHYNAESDISYYAVVGMLNPQVPTPETLQANTLPALEGVCIEMLMQHKTRGGRKALKKVQRYIDLLIDLEYPK